MVTLEKQIKSFKIIPPNPSGILQVQIEPSFKNKFQTYWLNGGKKRVIGKQKELLNEANKRHVNDVVEATRNCIDTLERYSKTDFIEQFGSVVEISLNPVVVVLSHERDAEIDAKAEGILKEISNPASVKKEIEIVVDIETEEVQNHPEIFEPIDTFLNRFHKLLYEQKIRRKFVRAYSDEAVEVNKMLSWTLKNLIAHKWDKKVPFSGTKVLEWDKLRVPNEHDFSRIGSRWICIDYQGEEKDKIVNWVKKTIDFVIKKRLRSPYIAVMADYWKFKDYEVPALIEEFCKIGASFEDFPKGSKDYRDALEKLEHELTGK